MNNTFLSLVLGPFYLILGFCLCFLLTVGIKTVINSFKPNKVVEQPKKPIKRKIKTKKTFKPERSIEINPDEVDKIYVKKVS